MRVKVLESFTPYFNYALVPLIEGEEVSGVLALFLLETGSNVEPADDAASDWTAARAASPSFPLAADEGDLDIDATAADVLAWVGESHERAVQALTQEQAKDKPRSTLVKQLEKIADPGEE